MANVASNAIKVEGLRDFLESMRVAHTGASGMVKDSLNESAAIVVKYAKANAPVRSGKLQHSIRALSTGREARVAGGGAKVPYFGFIDYGGTVGRYRRGAIHQAARSANKARFFAVRPFIKTGRILYPAFDAHRAEVDQALQTGLANLMSKAGVAVDGG